MTPAEIRVLLEKHHQGAYGWALRCCGRQPDDAEDVLQTVYLKVLAGRARFNGHSSFRTWLFALIRNTASDRLRAVRRWLTQSSSALTSAPPSLSPDQALWGRERTELLERALSRLPARQRQVRRDARQIDANLRRKRIEALRELRRSLQKGLRELESKPSNDEVKATRERLQSQQERIQEELQELEPESP
jgi:RNA polymerase sigma-70 factor (ECF subfamily)